MYHNIDTIVSHFIEIFALFEGYTVIETYISNLVRTKSFWNNLQGQDLHFQCHMSLNELRWEVSDIGGIVDDHCLSFLFIKWYINLLMGSVLFIFLVFCVVFYALFVVVLCVTNVTRVSGLSMLDSTPLGFL